MIRPGRKPPLGSRIKREHPRVRGLVGCWLFNEHAGLRAVNLVNNTPSAFAGTVGWGGGGVNFPSSGGIPANFVSAVAFTWIVRLKPSADTTYRTIMADPASGRMEAYLGPGHDLAIYSQDGNFDPGFSLSFPTNEWTHFALVRRGNSITAGLEAYKNGVLTGAENTSTYTPGDPSLNIGRTAASADPYTGTMDYVLIYNRGLLSDEIAWDYAEPYDFIAPPEPKIKYFVAVAPPGGFQSAWARGSNQLIGSGLHV